MKGHSRRAAPAKASRPSQLLSALAQCNDTVWEGHLVPKLKAQGSLANVTLSCKQLRVLCQSNACSLRFRCKNTQQHMEQLPARFPACTTVQYIADTPHDIGHLVQVLPVLSRLPRLTDLDVQATNSPASSPPLMALALELLHLRLPKLQQLVISIMGGWGDNAQPWKALGAASQLTRLEVYGFTDVPAELTLGNLSALSGLGSSLRALVVGADQLIKPAEVQQPQFQQEYGFLSALTALTQLMLPLPPSVVNFEAIRACTSLRNLSLSAVEEDDGDSGVTYTAELEDADCEALGCLVQLTELRLPKVQGTGSSAAFLQALKQLQQLRVLRVDGLVPSTALPVLASLPHMKEMGCLWEQEGEQQQRAVAAAVPPEQQLTGLHSMGASGHSPIPWSAFPQLLTVMQWDQWSTENFAGICKSCTQLRELASCEWRADTASLPLEAPAAQRTAAIAGLAKLPHLTVLHFSANDDAEIAALAAASQLQQLTLMVSDANLDTKACSAMSLTPLVLLRSLRRLELWLPGLVLTAADARRLISSMQCIPSVTITVMPSVKPAVLQALDEARAAHMKVPSEFEVDVNASWSEVPTSVNLAAQMGVPLVMPPEMMANLPEFVLPPFGMP